MANVIKTSVRAKKIDGTFQIDPSGSCDAIHYIYDNGFEELAVAVNMIISFENEYVKTQLVELWRQNKTKPFQSYLKSTGRFANSEMLTDRSLYINTATGLYVGYEDATEIDISKEILDPFGDSFTPKRYARKIKMNYYNAYEYRDKTLGKLIRSSLVSEMIKK